MPHTVTWGSCLASGSGGGLPRSPKVDQMDEYELIIIGQGSAAFAAAIKADELGVRTAMVGGNVTGGTVLGGTCVNVGCVPSKYLLAVGRMASQARRNPFRALRYGGLEVDFSEAIRGKDEVVKRLREAKYRKVLEKLEKVDYIPGLATFLSPSEVKVGRRKLRGRKFLIATGARARVPPIKGIDEAGYLTNEEAMSLGSLPSSMIVVGGRAQGLEFAQMFAHFGTEVTLLQRSDRILPDMEPEVSHVLQKRLREDGVEVHTNVSIERVSSRAGRKVVQAVVGGRERSFEAEQLLLAVGRRPNVEVLKPEKAGVRLREGGFIQVDEEMKTSSPNIWAAGDVTGGPELETLAAKEGATAVHNAFNDEKRKISLLEVPRAVFTYPEVASVGLTDSQAVERGIRCACTVLPLEFVPKAQILMETEGLVKMVVERRTKRVLGVHMLAPGAADLIHEGVLAVKFGLTVDDLIDTVHVFPTLGEAIKLAAQSFYRDVSEMSCCTE